MLQIEVESQIAFMLILNLIEGRTSSNLAGQLRFSGYNSLRCQIIEQSIAGSGA